MRYPSDDLTSAERARLAPHVTSLDGPVFALVNLPETVKGALFARYSRYPGTLRRLFLDEFAADIPEGGRPLDGEEGERAAGLYERVFSGFLGAKSRALYYGFHVVDRRGVLRWDAAGWHAPHRRYDQALAGIPALLAER